MMKRSQNGAFNGPPSGKAVADPAARQTHPFTPLGRSESFPAKRDVNVSAGIVVLGFSPSPATVFWFVVIVAIEAIKGVSFRGTRPHVSVEGIERVKPSLANCDTSTAVPPIVVMLRVIASTFHGLPRLIFGEIRREFTVLSRPTLTATRSRPSALKISDPNGFRFSAIANTGNEVDGIGAVHGAGNSQLSKLLPYESSGLARAYHSLVTVCGVSLLVRHDMNLTDRFVLSLGSFGVQPSFEPLVL